MSDRAAGDAAGRYLIRVKGRLDSRWSAWFDGMSLTTDSDGTTTIHGQVVDQSALHGLLHKLRDVGLPLISVTQVEPEQPAVPPKDPRSLIDPQKEPVMTSTGRTAATGRVPMDPLRKTAMIAGALYLLTFAASIPARFYFLDPVLSDPDYIVGSGADTRVLLGGLLDIVNALACIGTAVVLFKVVKRQNEALALGFVTSRLLEAAIISIGVVSLLTVVTLRQDLAGTAGADADSLVTVAASHVAVYDWTFLFGPNVMAAVNALLLGSLMYRSGLVPRAIPLLGLIGGPLLLASVTGIVFGTHGLDSGWHVIAAAPIFFWELSLGVYLVVKGFKPSPITARTPAIERDAELSPV